MPLFNRGGAKVVPPLEMGRTSSGKPIPLPRGRLARAEHQVALTTQRLDFVTSELGSGRDQLVAQKGEHTHHKEELIGTYNRLSTLRSNRAQLEMDLVQVKKDVLLVEEELEDKEREAIETRAQAELMRARLRNLIGLQGALHTAKLEAEHACDHDSFTYVPGRPTSPANLTREAQDREDRSQGPLHENLLSSVSEGAELEMESRLWADQCASHQQMLDALTCSHRDLAAQHASMLDAVRAAANENEKLREQASATKERTIEAQRDFDQLQGKDSTMDDAISKQSVGMTALQFTYHGQIDGLGPAIAKTRRRKQQADMVSVQRLEEIEAAGKLLGDVLSRPPTTASSVQNGRREQSLAWSERSYPSAAKSTDETSRALSPRSPAASRPTSRASPLTSRPASRASPSPYAEEAQARLDDEICQDDLRPRSQASVEIRPASRSSVYTPTCAGKGAAAAPNLHMRPPELRRRPQTADVDTTGVGNL